MLTPKLSNSKACSVFCGELASIYIVHFPMQNPYFLRDFLTYAKYITSSLSILKLSPKRFRCILGWKKTMMHFARDWGERPQPKSKWRGWRAERTKIVQTNLRRKKKLTPERIWIIFFGSQFRLLLAAQTISTSTNKKKCWLKHQPCNTVTVRSEVNSVQKFQQCVRKLENLWITAIGLFAGWYLGECKY